MSGGVSGDGWNWSTAARATDYTEKTVPVNYGGRGLSYDWEGTTRNINVGLATGEARQAAMPYTPDGPDLLPGTADVAAPDAPKGEAGVCLQAPGACPTRHTPKGALFGVALDFLPPTCFPV
jgi:hypothetical protein